LHPDCLHASKQHLAVGMYEALENDHTSTNDRNRKGCVSIFEWNNTDLKLLVSADSSGILELAWLNEEKIAAVSSAGDLRLFNFNEESNSLLEAGIFKVSLDGMLLSFDHSGSSGKFIASDSKGSAFLLDKFCKVIRSWHAHSFHDAPVEAWKIRYAADQDSVCYSGGDDSKLKVWDFRTELIEPVIQVNFHKAGVVEILPQEDRLLLSGSYDDRIALWDLRNVRKPMSDLNLHGGVWRISPHPNFDRTAAVACMYHGFALVNWHNGQLRSLDAPDRSNKLWYGTEWNRSGNAKLSNILATCTFNDNHLRIHEIEIPNEFNA